MRRGFTLVDLIALIIAISIIAFVAFEFFARASTGSGSARQLKDSTQVRGISQSMIVWANNNNGEYPLPSRLDLSDLTVAEKGRGKDTTANIFSILNYNGMISPGICVSPSESNSSISVDQDYEFTSPRSAVSPSGALWDPAFSADFTARGGGNLSYGHLQPSGTRGVASSPGVWATEPTGRLLAWRDTFDSTQAVLGNRGPEIASVGADYTPTMKNKSSNTFLIHGGRGTWEGNIGYNDGHVTFETSLKPTGALRYTSTSGERWDSLFFDEPDDMNQSNIFLGIFTTAGEKPSDFKSIWD